MSLTVLGNSNQKSYQAFNVQRKQTQSFTNEYEPSKQRLSKRAPTSTLKLKSPVRRI